MKGASTLKFGDEMRVGVHIMSHITDKTRKIHVFEKRQKASQNVMFLFKRWTIDKNERACTLYFYHFSQGCEIESMSF